ncbi:hypothetical protein [Fuchsiella alkaliacetigena]|uniref:hypothetical protein n=1 Tax=Fuchsiella alkaliacetigena TaxID=957042 RepID=UPI00200AC137|nr:hypothetical protein [Fuchsiella alkaliacetigena]MCK8825546.1 hypothetical protein [Fuchsiella alkaliacetigena]
MKKIMVALLVLTLVVGTIGAGVAFAETGTFEDEDGELRDDVEVGDIEDGEILLYNEKYEYHYARPVDEVIQEEYEEDKVDPFMQGAYSLFLPGLGMFGLDNDRAVKHLGVGIGGAIATGVVASQSDNNAVRLGANVAYFAVGAYSARATYREGVEYNERLLEEIENTYLSFNSEGFKVTYNYKF